MIFSVFWQKNLVKCVKTATYMYRQEVLRKTNFENCFFFYSGDLSQKSRTICETLKHIFHNYSLRVQRNTLRISKWSKKKWLSVLCLRADILDFCRKFVGRVAERAFQLSRSTLREKDVEKNILFQCETIGIWMSCFFDFDKKMPVFQNSNLSAQRKNSRRNIFQQLFFPHFWTWTRQISTFTIYVSKEHFQSKNFERKKWKISLSGLILELLGPGQKFSSGLTKLKINVQTNNLRKDPSSKMKISFVKFLR